MINILFILLSWTVSILFGWGSIRQSKGSDWYNPISNKQELVMIVINIALIVIIPAFFFELLIIRLNYLWIFNVIFGVLSITFIVYYLIKHPNISKQPSSNQNNTSSVKTRKLIERFLTVFNCVYFACTMFYSIVWSNVFYQNNPKKLTESIIDYLYPVAKTDNTLLISLSIVFWVALIVVFLTVANWNNQDDDGLKKYEPKRPISFFWNRVKQRGRKD